MDMNKAFVFNGRQAMALGLFAALAALATLPMLSADAKMLQLRSETVKIYEYNGSQNYEPNSSTAPYSSMQTRNDDMRSIQRKATYTPVTYDNRYVWNEVQTNAQENENRRNYMSRKSSREANPWVENRFRDSNGKGYRQENSVSDRLHNAMLDGYYSTKERMVMLAQQGKDPYRVSASGEYPYYSANTRAYRDYNSSMQYQPGQSGNEPYHRNVMNHEESVHTRYQ